MTEETPVVENGTPVATEDSAAPAVPGAKKRVRNRRKNKPNGTKSEGEEGGEGGETGGESAPEPEDDGTIKVFVGNLPFTTDEEEIKTLFMEAGEVVKVVIITRGTRSLGYGFVSYNTEEEATKAVATLDKKDLQGRPINVEVAKDKVPGVEGSFSRGGGRGFRGRGRGRGFRGGRGRGGRGGRGRGGPREGGEGDQARVDDETQTPSGDVGGEEEVQGEDASGERRGGGRGFRRGGRGRGGRGGRGRGPRGEGGEGAETTGEPSERMLFVANLPFRVTDEDLTAIFQEFSVTSAKVVRLRNGRSKGYGFVEVKDKSEQQRVLEELANVSVDGRDLVVRVAMAHQTPRNENEVNTEGEVVVNTDK